MKSKKNLKGFTLVELIVVMAVFGIIMLGAIQFLDPVNRMMKGASLQESNTASVDNVKRYFEGTLRYATALDVHMGELPTPSLASVTPEEQAACDFVDRYYTDSCDSSDKPINVKVHVMKIDNEDQGKIKESLFDVKAGFTYQKKNDEGVYVYDESQKIKSSIVSTEYTDMEMINNVYYKDYSMFISLGFNEMKAANEVAVPDALKADHYYGRIVPVTGYSFGSGVDFGLKNSKAGEIFSFTFTTYKNGEAKDGVSYYRTVDYDIEAEDGSTEHKTEDLFVSPYASANASLALVNLTGYSDEYGNSLGWCPNRRLKDSVITATDNLSDYELEKEPKGTTEVVKYVARRVVNDPYTQIEHKKDDGTIDGDNIYIVYTIPES
ncbi:MAG: prepilin-type N-terminal cleavage/methylation domain-containing protein [Ruminococcus flavefaciens]|nr:prepilin-type N-terminal cleavage/methylation domain-containing protein [Ruminococcus flavefaciens]